MRLEMLHDGELCKSRIARLAACKGRWFWSLMFGLLPTLGRADCNVSNVAECSRTD
jgi:hypothetical protein